VGAPRYNKRSAIEVLTFTLLVGVVANIMYSLSSLSGLYMLFASRVIIGFSTGFVALPLSPFLFFEDLRSLMTFLPASGTLSVARAHVAAQTTKEERTKFMGYAGAFQFIGFSLMPGATSIFSTIDM